MKGRIAIALGLLVLAGGVLLYPLVLGRPWSIDSFFDRVFLEFALERPLTLSQMRILEPYGIDFHADDLDDFSLDFERDELREAKRNLELLRGYDFDSLTPSQRRSAEVLEWFLANTAEREPFLLYDYPVNQLNGVQRLLPDFLVNVHQIGNEEEAADYRTRVGKIGAALDQVIGGLQARREAGNVPPSFVIGKVRQGIARFLEPPPAQNVLTAHFERSLADVEGLDDARRAELTLAVAKEVEGSVYPAYARLDAALAELEPVATDEAGVWRFPEGDRYYAWLVRRHTTTGLSPDQIHQMGLDEVDRIKGRIGAILQRMGLPAGDVATALAYLAQVDPRFHYADDEAGRAELLADYEAAVEAAHGRMPELFGRLPETLVEVQRVPEFLEAGAPGAYYQPPPFDGSRPGIFFVNLRNVSENPRWRIRTLAHHEALPGHHLQIALAHEMEDAPFFRRVLPFTAYSEGWALYAEMLASEHGLLPDPWDELGMLSDELFRAVRLVVDTGIHAKRWTRQQAIDYMLANTGKPPTEVLAEVDRYIVMPGQALAYKVGQLWIVQFRERAKQRLGDAFDLRAFHDVVLGGGAVPLEVLEDMVDEWVENGGAAQASAS